MTVGIGTLGRSNCVGAFDGGMLCVRARYKDVEGDFCLAMPMSTDVAIIFGRELYGEPKKQARVQLKSDGDVVRASVERFGTAYMSLEARLTENVPIDGPTYADRFHFKSYIRGQRPRGWNSTLSWSTHTSSRTCGCIGAAPAR